jgi:hypothetical protein
MSRHPLAEIIAGQFAADIPFDGQLLTSETDAEQVPNVIAHSSGRLCLAYIFEDPGTINARIKYVYTDVGRTSFSFITLTPAGSVYPLEASLCELANGDIGIVYLGMSGTSFVLRRVVLSAEGAVVTADTQIASYVAADVIASPFVIRTDAPNYLLVYTKVDGSDYRIEKRTSSDFLTWSAESEIAPAGISTAALRRERFLEDEAS